LDVKQQLAMLAENHVSQLPEKLAYLAEAWPRLLADRAEQGEFNVTMSCGIAIYKQGETQLDLGKVADDALYEAKRGGRNKVVLAQGKAA